MVALVILKEKGRAGAQRVRVCGVPFLKVTLPRKGAFAALAARRWAKRLKTAGIERAVFAKDFPFTQAFITHGVLPYDVRRLRLAAAPQIVCAALRARAIEPARATLAVCSDALGREEKELIAALARSVRYLSLSAPGAEDFAETLRFRCGVALQRSAAHADLTLEVRDRGEETGDVLRLFDARLCVEYAPPGELAEEVETERFLAALLDGGGIEKAKITVLGIEMNEAQAIS